MRNQDKQIRRLSIGAVAALLVTPWAFGGNPPRSMTPDSPRQLSTTSKQHLAPQSSTSDPTTALIENGESVPIPKELTEWMQKNGFRIINLIDGSGQIKAVDVYGREIPACTIEGTSIGGKCETGGLVPTHSNQVSILGYTPKDVPGSEPGTAKMGQPKDDPCVWQIINNRLVKVCW